MTKARLQIGGQESGGSLRHPLEGKVPPAWSHGGSKRCCFRNPRSSFTRWEECAGRGMENHRLWCAETPSSQRLARGVQKPKHEGRWGEPFYTWDPPLWGLWGAEGPLNAGPPSAAPSVGAHLGTSKDISLRNLGLGKAVPSHASNTPNPQIIQALPIVGET